MSDVVVIGGGVVGLSIAWELAGQGAAVRVIEQGQFGQESSWAGAGMLPPGGPTPAADPESQLRAHSARLWPDWVTRLAAHSNIDTGYAACGALELRPESEQSLLDAEIAHWQSEGVAVERLASPDVTERFSTLNAQGVAGYWLPGYAQVRNPRLVKALLAGCQAEGVTLSPGQPVQDLECEGGRIRRLHTAAESVTADHFVLATGAWADGLLRRLSLPLSMEPIRGQIVLLEQPSALLNVIVQQGLQYLVPRSDGRVLVGSTEERAGFDKRNTATAIADLLAFAQQLVPGLKSARFERCWAGLRPHRPGGLPYIGRAPEVENLWIAAGHFRAGLQMSPITARLMRELVLQQPTTIPVESLPQL